MISHVDASDPQCVDTLKDLSIALCEGLFPYFSFMRFTNSVLMNSIQSIWEASFVTYDDRREIDFKSSRVD